MPPRLLDLIGGSLADARAAISKGLAEESNMKTSNDWLGWPEDEDSNERVLSSVEKAKLQKLGEMPELENFILGLMDAEDEIRWGWPQ
jgi:hypothetical protein